MHFNASSGDDTASKTSNDTWDYAPTNRPCEFDGNIRPALIADVVEGSPADRAGITPGCKVLSVESQRMRDIIDWFWLADGFEVDLEIEWEDDTISNITLERQAMEDWGIVFGDNLFDGVMTCCNACTFCFMSMLPEDMRDSLYLRDDDYRLSFLQGNFVTLTNMTDDDVDRIIEMGISPIHVSLHSIDQDVRQALMGNNQLRGLEVLDDLLEAGIDVHTQVVLVPGVNDGEVLDHLLQWALDEEHVLSVGIVPLGYTRFQDKFSSSFADPESALAIVEQVSRYQRESRDRHGITKIHLADEFYVHAYPGNTAEMLPPDEFYDGYPQFYDGIGMLRTLVDGWSEICSPDSVGQRPSPSGGKILITCGMALAPILQSLLDSAGLQGRADVLGVDNRFFGGNVDVTGLLTARDVIDSISKLGDDVREYDAVLAPDSIFNDDGLTLDGMTAAGIEGVISAPFRVVCYNAEEILGSMI